MSPRASTDPESVGREVLKVYQEESPSAIQIEQNRTSRRFFAAQKTLWQERMKLPLRAMRGATVFDFGCGTGETDVFLGRHGAQVHGADFNPKSIRRATKLAKQAGLSRKLRFRTADIHGPLFGNGAADFAISLGVLPHVRDPEAVFGRMARSVKDEGFIVVGFLEELGIVQRLLHRTIVRAVTGMDEKAIVRVARQAFPEHIRRSIRFGQRTERSVIFDYLVNRHMYGLPLEGVLGWFKRHGIRHYSSWPSIEAPGQINPHTTRPLPLTHPILSDYRALLRLRWLFTQHEDASVFDELQGHSKIGGFRRVVDEYASVLAGLVQEQKGIWSEKALKDARRLSEQVIQVFDRCHARLHKDLSERLLTRMVALNMGLRRINDLQKQKAPRGNQGWGLFKELNGLGTLFLVGIKNGRRSDK